MLAVRIKIIGITICLLFAGSLGIYLSSGDEDMLQNALEMTADSWNQGARMDIFIKLASQRCDKQPKDEPLLRDDDFTWEYSFQETGRLYSKFYQSGKRLPNRVYFSKNSTHSCYQLATVIRQ